MADNYLEKKFEEYAIRKSTAKTKKIVSTGPKPEHIEVRFPTRRVFVTGGANGIGKAIVQAFRKIGCRVAFCDNDRKNGSLTAQTSGARFYPVDVCDSKALQSCMHDIFTTWGDIDILINNVGISRFSPISETSVDDFDRIIATNLRPVFITAREMAMYRQSLSRPNNYGRIVNITSTRYLMSEPGSEGYAASKGGIYSLTHALSLSLAPLHITVNSIAPGWIATPMFHKATDNDPPRLAKIMGRIPAKSVGDPMDVGMCAAFLCSDAARYISGTCIPVDGGALIGF